MELMIERTQRRFLQIMLRRLLILLPEMNPAATSVTTPTSQQIVFINAKAGTSGEKRNNTDANTDAEGGGGITASKRMRIGDEIRIVLVVIRVESRSDNE